MENYLRRKLRKFIRLCVHPSQRFQIIEEIMLGKSRWKINLLVGSPLRWHGNAANFLNLRVVRWAYTVQVTRNLCPQIRNTDELFQNVLRHNISVTRFLSQMTQCKWINKKQKQKKALQLFFSRTKAL